MQIDGDNNTDNIRTESAQPSRASAIGSADSLIAAIEGNYAGMSHGDLVLTCQMLVRGRAAWRADAERMKPVIEHYLKRAKHLRDQSEIDRCEAALNPPNDQAQRPGLTAGVERNETKGKSNE